MEKTRYALGSGYLYIVAFTFPTIPSDATIETDANLLGRISGGASLEYKPSYTAVEDDLGFIKDRVLTGEDVKLKSGVMTWNGDTLAALTSTARVTTTSAKRTVKLGGLSNVDGVVYLIRFVSDKDSSRVTIAGINEAGLTFSYTKDKPTVINAEFTGQPMDADGTLVQYDELLTSIIPLTVVSIAGSTTGKTAISVLPDLSPGNSYVYKTGSGAQTLPALGDVCTAGYTAWTYTTEITATTGNYIAIVEIDSENKAVKAGQVVVASKA